MRRVITHARERCTSKNFVGFFPPGFVFLLQCREPLAAVFCITLDELETLFFFWQWWGTDINSEHVTEP